MTHRTRFSLLAAAALSAGFIAPLAAAGDEHWIKDDYDKAMKVAKEKNLPVLIDFTGSDWCGWCIRLTDEVFSQSMFQETAPAQFVLLELDYPTDKVPQPAEVKARNQELAKQYEIRGYPTILLTDPNGVAFAKTGYRAGGPGPYLEHLQTLADGKKKRDELLTQAAKLMDEAMALADEGIMVPNRMAMMEQIIAFDADGAAGLRAKYEAELKAAAAEQRMGDLRSAMEARDGERVMALAAEIRAALPAGAPELEEANFYELLAMAMTGRIKEAFARIDADVAAATDATPEQRQEMLAGKVSMAMQTGDVDLLNDVLDEVIAVAPDSDFSEMINNDREMLIAETAKAKAAQEAKKAPADTTDG